MFINKKTTRPNTATTISLAIIALFSALPVNPAIADNNPDKIAIPEQVNNKTIFYQPKTVLVYNKQFAKRFGLDETKAIDLDPGINAISLTFKKEYSFTFLDGYNVIDQYHLADLSPAEAEVFHDHLEVLPVIFKGVKLPMFTTYDCYMNFYLNSNDPRVKDLKMPTEKFIDSNNEQKFIRTIVDPIDAESLRPNYTDSNPDYHYLR